MMAGEDMSDIEAADSWNTKHPKKARTMELSVGRIIHVNNAKGACSAAIIVRVWGDTPKSAVSAVVFRDSSNDKGDGFNVGSEPSALTAWAKSIQQGDGRHQFHDPRECPKAVVPTT